MIEVLVWGCGGFEKRLHEERWLKSKVVGYIANDGKEIYRGQRVYTLKDIAHNKVKRYDYIITAFENGDEAYIDASREEIDKSKLIILKPGMKYRCFNDDVRIKEILSDKFWNMYLSNYGEKINSFVDDDALKYSEMNRDVTFDIVDEYKWYITTDKYKSCGSMDEYFWQDLWGAERVIALNKGKEYPVHYDIGSSIHGFIAHLLASNINVNVIDVRPFPAEVKGLTGICDDVSALDKVDDHSIFTLSALCSIEHFGLGRYGDSINPTAWSDAIYSIQRKMCVGGHILISVPVGKQRVEFNAHRVFRARTIIDKFDLCDLMEYDVVLGDCSGIEEDVDVEKYDYLDVSHRVGMFHFIKNKSI